MKEISAKEAYELMQKDPGYVYLDVRSVPEFEQGHAAGAINIPLFHFQPGMGMMPNQDFTKVAEANLPKDVKLVIGCQSGGRSARACEILAQLGYKDTANIRGGFVGMTDPMGRVVAPGWSMENLPVCRECSPDAHYDSLASKVK